MFSWWKVGVEIANQVMPRSRSFDRAYTGTQHYLLWAACCFEASDWVDS